jgi:CMP-N-acetylneuraminic acid synthetase
MYKNKNVFCFILARGGSKGLPRKNTLMIAGKPLIGHNIDLAKNVKYIDKIFVSTEDKEIKEISLKHGAIIIDRPLELASDTAYYLDAVKHMMSKIEESYKKNYIVVILETTFPMRKIEHVEKCIEMYDENVDVIMSVNEVKTHPSRMFTKNKDGFLSYLFDLPRISNRQEATPVFAANGSIIVTNHDFLQSQQKIIFGGRMKGFVLDEKYSMDIDSKLDYDICKLLMESEHFNSNNK